MKIPFGMYQGKTIDHVIQVNPSYAMWAHKNVWWFNMDTRQVQRCVGAINKKLASTSPKLFAGMEYDDIPF